MIAVLWVDITDEVNVLIRVEGS